LATPQLVVADVGDDRPQPSPKRHLRSVGRKPGESPNKTLLSEIANHFAICEEALAQPIDFAAVTRREFGERRRLSTQDLGD
jgi:hypothetical protein